MLKDTDPKGFECYNFAVRLMTNKHIVLIQ